MSIIISENKNFRLVNWAVPVYLWPVSLSRSESLSEELARGRQYLIKQRRKKDSTTPEVGRSLYFIVASCRICSRANFLEDICIVDEVSRTAS